MVSDVTRPKEVGVGFNSDGAEIWQNWWWETNENWKNVSVYSRTSDGNDLVCQNSVDKVKISLKIRQQRPTFRKGGFMKQEKVIV